MNTDRDLETLSASAKDALYVGVGLGVLALQKVQVRRRELSKTVDRRYGSPISATAASFIDKQIEAVELQLDRVIDEVEALLPTRAGALVARAHGLARLTRNQLRTIVLNAS